MKRYTFIIGDAWGMPVLDFRMGMHYWIYQGEGQWQSACGIASIDKAQVWSGTFHISLYYNEGEETCQECLKHYMDTSYGQKHGVKAPYTNTPVKED
ncbi:hypothetical protein LCGC14_1921620 [marine sediment metagenome]|uniref:Uncharacterized protein n=1 Tax=marine sediment metagenome TaxID=412755 RepID=A0A0F9INE1_9ZZZZ